jgi:translation elongation factor EF-4
MKHPLELILALNKIELNAAKLIDVVLTVSGWLSMDDPESIVLTMARNCIGIAEPLHAVCCRVPPLRPLPDDNTGEEAFESL